METNKISKRYDRISSLCDIMEAPMEHMFSKWRKELLKEAEGKTLEVGIGTGKNIAHYPSGVELTGIDFSEKMILCDNAIFKTKKQQVMKAKKTSTLWTFSLIAFLAIAVAGCSGNNSSNVDLSNNEQQKEEAFQQILNDEELFDEFMNQMMDDTEYMNRMMENQQLMNNMFMDENMDYIMDHNTGIDQHMMNNMMNRLNRDTSMAREWDNMMQGNNPMD